MDNSQGCTQTARGTVARRQAYNYEMGLGHVRFDEAFGAWASDHRYSESNHRRFYRRWAQLMAADSWPESEAAKAAAEQETGMANDIAGPVDNDRGLISRRTFIQPGDH